MYRLLESIRCEKGELQNLPYHQARMDASVEALSGKANSIMLGEIKVPEHCRQGLFKCRVIYGKTLESVEFLPYQRRVINTLKVVDANEVATEIATEIDYSCKFADRAIFHRLLEKCANCDDILIVKNGLLTDTSYTNILFFDGRLWLTPALPLLQGTQRAKLLAEDKIVNAAIRPSDIAHFQKARLINAMMRFEDGVDIDIGKIFI
jgi:4-amino-4-deoxychorismate lyase